MKRDGVVCLVIVAYCLLASFVMFRPDVSATQKASAQSKPNSNIQFDTRPDLINPNQVFSIVNSDRNSSGSDSLQANSKLADLATARAKDMVDRNYYAHKNPDGKYFYDLLSQYGVKSDHSCENLDMVFSKDPSKVVADWMSSTHGHRECMLNSTFTEAGYAVAKITNIRDGSSTVTGYLVVAIHSTDIH